jgi:hypothetical protein
LKVQQAFGRKGHHLICKSLDRLALAFLLGTVCSGSALAQEAAPPSPGPDYKLLSLIAHCPDIKCLNGFREQLGKSKLARIVYYEKWMLLEPARDAGEGLLHNLPESQTEQSQMMALPDWSGDATESKPHSKKDESLAEIYEAWPRSLADAAMAFPQYLPAYIRFGTLAPNDVHSDYTGNAERVCRSDPARFQAAFYRLDRKTQTQLRKFVFNPDKCQPIFLSESD